MACATNPPAANTIYTGSGKNTLASIASAINSANLGLTVNVLADSSGSRLSLVSGTSGAAGQLTITSALTDANLVTTANPTGAINYNPGVKGQDASLTIDGVPSDQRLEHRHQPDPRRHLPVARAQRRGVRQHPGAGSGGHRQRQSGRREHGESIRHRLQLADQRHQHPGRPRQLGQCRAAVWFAHAIIAAAGTARRP